MVAESGVFVLLGVGLSTVGESTENFALIPTTILFALACVVAILVPFTIIDIKGLAAVAGRVARSWGFLLSAFLICVIIMELIYNKKNVSMMMFSASQADNAWWTAVRLRFWTAIAPAIFIACACLVAAGAETKRNASVASIPRLSVNTSILITLVVGVQLSVSAFEQTKVDHKFAELEVRSACLIFAGGLFGVELAVFFVMSAYVKSRIKVLSLDDYEEIDTAKDLSTRMWLTSSVVITTIYSAITVWWFCASALLLPKSMQEINFVLSSLQALMTIADIAMVWSDITQVYDASEEETEIVETASYPANYPLSQSNKLAMPPVPNMQQVSLPYATASPAFFADLRRARRLTSAQARQDVQPLLDSVPDANLRRDNMYSVGKDNRQLRSRNISFERKQE